MDFKKLSQVTDSAHAPKSDATSESKKKVIIDALRKKAQLKRQVMDSKSYRKFKVTDTFKNLKKRIKDELEETETTEEAVEVLIEALAEAPAEQVVAAATEVLAEIVEVLEGDSDEGDSDEGDLDTED